MTLVRALCVLLAMGVVAHAQPPVDREASEAEAETEAEVEPVEDAEEPEEPEEVPEPAEEAPEEEAEAELQDEYEEEEEEEVADASNIRLRYFLERIVIRGNERTRARVIRDFVELERGAVVDPESDELEAIEWRLRGTGWFKRVQVSLEPGRRRNWVVLVIEVAERNSIVLSGLTFGVSEGLNGSRDTSRDTVPYLGATVSDTNFAGLGASLSFSTLLSTRAYGFRLGYDHPRLFPRGWGFRVSPFFYKARQYFGNEPLVSWSCEDPTVDGCEDEAEARNAVIFYRRSGVSVGTGTHLGSSTQLSIDYQLDILERRAGPDAASELHGTDIRPVDFSIRRGTSFVSMVRLHLGYDKRDDPAMTNRGVLVSFNTDLGHHALGGDYDFLRARVLFRAWQPLSFGSLRFGLFAGAVFGEAPFYLKFNVSDLTDLIPSRLLEMQLDRRAPPNLLNTSISEMRNEELAARLDLEYAFPLYRSHGNLRGINAYFNSGRVHAARPARHLRGHPGLRGWLASATRSDLRRRSAFRHPHRRAADRSLHDLPAGDAEVKRLLIAALLVLTAATVFAQHRWNQRRLGVRWVRGALRRSPSRYGTSPRAGFASSSTAVVDSA